MSRRRYISTKLSLDARINKLALQAGDFAALLYTWMIPHAEDDCRLPGDPEELLMLVIPGRRDKSVEDVSTALAAMEALGLITWSREPGNVYVEFPPTTFYTYQSYIGADKRRSTAKPAANSHLSADNSAQQRKTPQNAAEPRIVSPSPSPTLSPSPSPSREFSSEGEKSRARTHEEKHGQQAAQANAHVSVSLAEKPRPVRPDVDQPPGVEHELWQALVAGIGHEPATRAERVGWQNWLRQLNEARASPADIAARCTAYRKRYGPDIPLTPKALVEHWSEFASPTHGGSSYDATLARRAEDDRLAAEKHRLARELLGDWAASYNPRPAVAGN